jgi:Fe2+ or Zn2+ uptake regulation protein
VPGVRPPEADQTGFTILDYSISFTGICASCQQPAERRRWQSN